MAAPPRFLGAAAGLAKLGPPSGTSIDRTRGSIQAPSATTAGAELSTESSIFLIKPPDTVLIYSADRQYAQVIITLLTAGPVAVSTKQQLTPVLSGKGSLLQTGVPFTLCLAKGQKLYGATTAISRLALTIQPFPWLEQITGTLRLLGVTR